jgi:hypothetical protein
MTKDELLEKLTKIYIRQDGLRLDEEGFSKSNPDEDHMEADSLLLEYISDERITKIFNEIEKWYI